MGRPRSFDEVAAVAEAGRLFARYGYEGTSVDDLVRGLGIHRGSLYSVFGSKRALYLRVLGEHVTALDGSTVPPRDADLTLLLRAAVERAPVDAQAAALVGDGLRALERSLRRGHLQPAPDDEEPSAAVARLLGEHLVRRATRTHPLQEDA